MLNTSFSYVAIKGTLHISILSTGKKHDGGMYVGWQFLHKHTWDIMQIHTISVDKYFFSVICSAFPHKIISIIYWLVKLFKNGMIYICCWQVLSCVRLFATPWTIACQAPLSMGFFQARILEWVSTSFSIIHLCAALCLVSQSCPTHCDPMDHSPPSSSVHGDSPRQEYGVGCHALSQRIFPTQESLPPDRESAYNVRVTGDADWIPQSEISPGGGHSPTPVFLSGESHGQRSLVGSSP